MCQHLFFSQFLLRYNCLLLLFINKWVGGNWLRQANYLTLLTPPLKKPPCLFKFMQKYIIILFYKIVIVFVVYLYGIDINYLVFILNLYPVVLFSEYIVCVQILLKIKDTTSHLRYMIYSFYTYIQIYTFISTSYINQIIIIRSLTRKYTHINRIFFLFIIIEQVS